MKTPFQGDGVTQLNQVAQDMMAFAFMLNQMEHDPNGTYSLMANSLLLWASMIFDSMEGEGRSK